MSSGPSRSSSSCAELLRDLDWAATPLGPYEQWSIVLKSYVSMVLEMPGPAIIFWGPDLLQLYNDGYSTIMGPRHPRYFGAPYRECWPDTYPVIYPWMQRVLAGEVVTVDKTLFKLTRHGFLEEAYFTFTFSPLRDGDGVIRGILQPVVEVTGDVLRVRRDDTLRELEGIEEPDEVVQRAMRVAAKNVHDITFLRFYSPTETAEHGPTVAEVSSSRVPVVVSAANLLGAPHSGPWDVATRDAYVVPVARSGALHGVLAFGISPHLHFDDAYRSFFVGFAREVAAQMDARAANRAEQALLELAESARQEAESERQRLQSVFMQAPLAIGILVGPEYEILLANPSICEIWQRPLGAVLGRPLFEAIPELSGQGIRELLDGVRSSGQPFMGTEVPMQFRRAADDTLEERFFNFVYQPLHDAGGSVVGVIGLGIDVSMLVRARRAAERLATDLDTARRDAELARDTAQHANLAKDEFLAMLGHELRNPLAPIFTALEIMRLKQVSSTSRELEIIERQARHLGVLVDDLLDISRIRSGKIELRRQQVRLHDVLTDAMETASPVLEKRRHHVTLNVAADLEVHGDKARLTQVFANLLTNAAKYTNEEGRIDVQARALGDDVVVDVIDTGRGISQEMLPRVFELFVQGPQNIDRAHGGLGLGLAIVRSLVVLHGGSVEARSDGPGRGSTFSVRLPLATRASTATDTTAAIPTAPLPTPRGVGKRLLVVDDNEDAAMLVADALSLSGHECTVVHDGLEALVHARASVYDAVLLDIGLPGMDGYEVARQLRGLPGWDQVTLIAITGYGQPGDLDRARDAGFDHHMVKPANLATLLQQLARRR